MSTAKMPSGPGPELASSTQSLVLHVLCPSLPQPNRFTLKDLPLSTTVAHIKNRLSQSIPSHPLPETQRLFYLGKPLLNDNVTLQTVLDTANGSEFSMHLVLPPAPPSLATSSARSPGTDRSPLQQNPLYMNRVTMDPLQGQELRYRGPTIPSPLGEADIGMALRQNVDVLRRQLDTQERNGQLPRTQPLVATTGVPSNLQTSNPASPSPQTPWQQVGSGLSHSSSFIPSSSTPATPTTAPFAMPSRLSSLAPGTQNPNTSSYPPGEVRLRLQLIRQHVTSAEEQLSRGIAPPMDQIILLRTQLFNLLDDQYRRPLPERDGSIETLLTRVFNLYTRADQLRATQTTFPNLHHGASEQINRAYDSAPLYLLSSPTGYQALVASSDAADVMHMSLGALGSGQIPFSHGGGPGGQPPVGQPNPDSVVLENVVRQAVLNQRAAEDGQLGLARNIRRLWLFVRLYFFCYMFSDPGTWARVFYLSLAVIASILSETSVPRRLYQMVLSPVQRHLEGLVQFTPEDDNPPRPQGTGVNDGEGRVQQQVELQEGRGAGFPAGLRQNLRRVERSVALFIASLVPGVGERHIEVRNAAEAARNAERARQEEEERRRQEELAAAEEHQLQGDSATDQPEATE